MGKIMIVEDEESVNRGITFTLKKEGHEVISCTAIAEAEKCFEQDEPQLIISDINLPDGSGLDFITRVREKSKVYIICLTARDMETDYVIGYGAGADDYVAKPFSLSVLSLKIEAFFNRSKGAGEEVVRSGDIRVNIKQMRVWLSDHEIALTKSEWKMLQMFLNHPRQILSKNQILEQMFDVEGDFVDENTIAVNIRRLREKIEPDLANPEYIKNIRGIGYRWAKECNSL